MMTEMFLIAGVDSSTNTTAAPTNETTTAPDSGGKELRTYVNLRPLLCSESELSLIHISEPTRRA